MQFRRVYYPKSWHSLVSTCPIIEFSASCFNGNKETFVSILDKTLQRGTISAYFDLSSVVFEAQSLKHLNLRGFKLNSIENIHFKYLQRLSLSEVYISDATFEKIISICHLIEDVILFLCDGLKTIHVMHKHHKYFKGFEFWGRHGKGDNVNGMKESVKAAIDVPGMVKFYYQGDIPSSIAFTATTSSDQWKSNMCLFFYDDHPSSWFLKLNKFLDAISRSEISLSLFYNGLSNNRQNIVDVLDTTCDGLYKSIVVVEQLKLSLSGPSSSYSFSHVINNMFRICCPRNIIQYWCTGEWDRAGKKLAEFLCKIFLMEIERENYFRGQDLEEVCREVFVEDGQKWCPVNRQVCQNVRCRAINIIKMFAFD
ncbi:hypothetical protein DH2020_013199 [Rehmannia glutinosa]|uniref:F-box/LRR-repeat protein 15/At3g58940/PEG3-like LRR domain-containing protein n=1 Tax=Rehmannia glutinosa TaxID=99300 RepID=A0ABR0X2B0_REHGL